MRNLSAEDSDFLQARPRSVQHHANSLTVYDTAEW